MHVIGSLDFVQTLLAQRLFDRLNLWVYPIVLGHGKKVFAEGTGAGQPDLARAGRHLRPTVPWRCATPLPMGYLPPAT